MLPLESLKRGFRLVLSRIVAFSLPFFAGCTGWSGAIALRVLCMRKPQSRSRWEDFSPLSFAHDNCCMPPISFAFSAVSRLAAERGLLHVGGAVSSAMSLWKPWVSGSISRGAGVAKDGPSLLCAGWGLAA